MAQGWPRRRGLGWRRGRSFGGLLVEQIRPARVQIAGQLVRDPPVLLPQRWGELSVVGRGDPAEPAGGDDEVTMRDPGRGNHQVTSPANSVTCTSEFSKNHAKASSS